MKQQWKNHKPLLAALATLAVLLAGVVLIWLARLAQTKLGWGMWTMVAAILIGLVTAAVSTWSTVQRLLMKKDEGSAKKGVSFNEHI